MVFSSSYFLFMFLPLVFLLYYAAPSKFKNLILSIASIYFYAFGEKYLVLLMLTSAIVDYRCGILIEQGKKRLGLGISLTFNLLSLGFFKYFNFTFDNFKALLSLFDIHSPFFEKLPEIALPIGISFYTFQTMSYTIDVYRGEVKANRNFINFLAFVTMFPQLVAGPIVRYIDIHKQLNDKQISLLNFKLGSERFIVGLAKKMLIANTFASIADEIFSQNIDNISSLYAWLGIFAYAIQIYFDFSGYSDMAIGLGRMMGFTFLENFNYPYISRSIQEFWRRWHISLSTWFRDYLYIPLGGNRKGKSRTYINLFIVFFVTGLWHGASWNFIFWGLFHGLFLIIERLGFDKILAKLWKPLQHIYTLLIVLIGWVYFRAPDLKYGNEYVSKMFNFSNGNISILEKINFLTISYDTLFFGLMAIMFSIPVYKYIDNLLNRKMFLFVRPVIFILLFFLCIIYVAADSYNPFIYFKF